jgi:hypothetical protein
MMKLSVIDYHKGKCKLCKKKKMISLGICNECRQLLIENAKSKSREHNPFIG